MKNRLKYHLFPEQAVKYLWQGKECEVSGIRKAPDMKLDEKTNEWTRLEPKPDSEGRFWWVEADLIAIVQGRKSFYCDVCRAYKAPKMSGMWGSRRILEYVYYVGLPDMEGCYPPPWGYTTKICLDCAAKIFKDAVVYRCDPLCDWSGWWKKAPKIDRPPIKFADELKSVLERIQPNVPSQ